MPVYKYVAVNPQKIKVKGKYIASDEKELAALLARNNLYLISSTIYKDGTPSAFFTTGTGKVGLKDLTPFCRQFSIMINAGIPAIDCLESLKKQKYSAYFRSILQVIYDDVKGGEMLSFALDKHAKVFPNFFRSMVHVGEASGRLDTVFLSLADYYEADDAIKRKAKSALSYPLFLLGLAVAIVVIMLTFVVPTFKDTMEKMDVEATGITAIVYDVSNYITENWQPILLGTVLVVFFVGLFLQTKTGKYTLDVLGIYVPLVNTVQIDMVSARFSRAFSILLDSGMDLSTSLDTVGLILGNQYMQKRFTKAASRVKHGMTLTEALRRYHLFPEILVQMVAVGERTASLPEVLKRSCAYFDQKVDASLNSFTSKIQPIMLLVIGAIVGVLFLAVYSPMMGMMNIL